MKAKLNQILQSHIPRRKLIRNATIGGSLWATFPELVASNAPTQQHQDQKPKRFLQVFLKGAWDSAFATDPVIGSKTAESGYEPVYASLESSTVPGKDNLVMGEAILAAKDAFTSVSTAFVNGIFIDVTAHELAVNYVLSGQMSLNRAVEYPAFLALAAEQRAAYPPHVVIGHPIPLGDTKLTSPPIQIINPSLVPQFIGGVYNTYTDPSIINRAHKLIGDLDRNFLQKLPNGDRDALKPWFNSQANIEELYARGVKSELQLSPEILDRYQAKAGVIAEQALPMALLLLKTGTTPFVTVNWDGFDTHREHMDNHLPLMKKVFTQINALVKDMRETPDPDSSTHSLADTTTILVTSEFVRTPKFNASEGTDHWKSASAILMGRDIRDNITVGKTDDQALPMGWENGVPVPKNEDTVLLPDHLASSILRSLGAKSIADGLSAKHLDEIFA